MNPQDRNPQRIKITDKQYIQNLDYTRIVFPVSVKQYHKIEKQNNINNLNLQLSDKIPVIFHKLRGYDSHVIMQEIGEIVLTILKKFKKSIHIRTKRKRVSNEYQCHSK